MDDSENIIPMGIKNCDRSTRISEAGINSYKPFNAQVIMPMGINQQLSSSLKWAFCVGIFLVGCFAVPVFCWGKQADLSICAKINPNTASVSELAQMPTIGPKRAQAIIDYRNEQLTLGEKKVFETAADLEKVKGIGKKTAEKLTQFFEFSDFEEK